jgi:hypothetical protein
MTTWPLGSVPPTVLNRLSPWMRRFTPATATLTPYLEEVRALLPHAPASTSLIDVLATFTLRGLAEIGGTYRLWLESPPRHPAQHTDLANVPQPLRDFVTNLPPTQAQLFVQQPPTPATLTAAFNAKGIALPADLAAFLCIFNNAADSDVTRYFEFTNPLTLTPDATCCWVSPTFAYALHIDHTPDDLIAYYAQSLLGHAQFAPYAW